ncbi:putative superfamily II RNA helicase [Encephalitozoon hellem ATCC 50504]|uniref:Ski2 RNA helicase n=1 Tax=Encephalitozoon hellem TaxID=27973 RepID=A0A9Q9F9J3_ENCHE|nr:putative superfamily II RNA helicase [Encephalitozoon hellem ATCC 50504]AFM98313.1 putative superfamily II RNA helicase [Encephalitozoon hellem ATCC 50504]UTX43192.1 Ski2 RNA helicase [Encephalitozoon hellem]WEL38649.1 Ski2 RNA helicase [Encephalitozoon hellem]|eukprot:XP_003887294.1 putative superfamily II RNA helicase [Encephalitozoon hellem ATCC 50504]
MNHEEYFKTKHPVYTNISAQFTGIGHLVIDGGALISNISKRYGVGYESLPLHTYMHGTRFMLSNLQKAGFHDIMVFFRAEYGHRKVIREYLMRRFDFMDISQVYEYIENERVALVLGGSEEDELRFLYECLGISLYCGVLDHMEFRVPNVYAFVYSPLERRVERKAMVFHSEDSDSEGWEGIDDEIKKINPMMSLKEVDELFKSRTKAFRPCSFSVPTELCRKLIKMFRDRTSGGMIDFDGRLLLREGESESEEELIGYDEIIKDGHKDIESKNVGMELDLLVSGKEISPGSAAAHMKNIRKSAQSLFDGKLLYTPIVRTKGGKAPKMSQKQRQIIEENERRMREEKKAKETAWLKNFFGKYKALDYQGKKNLLESVKRDGSGIYRRVLLLKIEFYADMWNLKKRSEDCDESIIVPCYLSCIEYIREFGKLGLEDQAPDAELEFVFQNLIGCGFEATVRELVEKHGLGHLNLEFFTDDTSAPSEFDICFQLKHTGDKLQRSVNSKKDPRVLFKPDEWQVRLLDLVDKNKSAVISAPTSAGKTFICFYAIEKILKESDTNMVIFCLPTKALVNQVSADIYARFTAKVNSKTFLQGSLMKEFSIAPWNCQVLIVIPSLLESVLNTPPKGFLERVKYIIIDEVHKISSEEMGIPIERIIHLSPCPMLVLSATLGNIEGFYGWMKKIEEEKGRECELVSYDERYCELKPYVYSCEFKPKIVPINNLFAYSYSHIKRFGFGNDMSFLPEELLHLYDSICAVLSKDQEHLIGRITPENFFKSNIVTKKEVREYGKHLLETFQKMIEGDLLSEKQVKYVYKLQTKEARKAFETVADYSNEYLLENILDLLMELKERDMFPCIVFNTDRDFASKLALKVYQQLESMDMEKKKDKFIEKMKKEAKRARDAEKTKESWIEESIAAEKSFQMRSDKKNIKYTFLDPLTKLTDYELSEETKFIKNTSFEFIDMIYRGIGVHHAHMNRKYRSLVEILFRQKHLQVLFATETLALGINMPCRTVVFAGDSLQLDPMNYKQMAGRAGRRGFDTLGNVVFMGIPKQRVQNLMVSLLPNIKGVYTYTNTSFVGFDLKDSLIKNPLIESTLYNGQEELSRTIGGLSISGDKSSPYDLSDVYGLEERRAELVNYQLSLLKPYFLPKSYLCDLVIGNRDSDPGILSFALLLESGALSLDPDAFMITLAHFFETKPLLFDMGCTLPPLEPAVYEFCRKINSISKSSVSKLYPPILRSLQKMSSAPLHTIDSFLRVENLDKIKNSYLLDFFRHGSWNRIAEENCIGTGELFKSLSAINNVVLSLIRLYDTYGLCSDDRSKIIRFHSMFEPKFKAMFA